MKASLHPGKRLAGAVLLCIGLASVQPLAAHAAPHTGQASKPASHAVRIPKACQGIENQLSSLSAEDFPPPNPVKEEAAALRALLGQLRACEAQHGGSR